MCGRVLLGSDIYSAIHIAMTGHRVIAKVSVAPTLPAKAVSRDATTATAGLIGDPVTLNGNADGSAHHQNSRRSCVCRGDRGRGRPRVWTAS